jgi:hypothetical protein
MPRLQFYQDPFNKDDRDVSELGKKLSEAGDSMLKDISKQGIQFDEDQIDSHPLKASFDESKLTSSAKKKKKRSGNTGNKSF